MNISLDSLDDTEVAGLAMYGMLKAVDAILPMTVILKTPADTERLFACAYNPPPSLLDRMTPDQLEGFRNVLDAYRAFIGAHNAFGMDLAADRGWMQ